MCVARQPRTSAWWTVSRKALLPPASRSASLHWHRAAAFSQATPSPAVGKGVPEHRLADEAASSPFPSLYAFTPARPKGPSSGQNRENDLPTSTEPLKSRERPPRKSGVAREPAVGGAIPLFFGGGRASATDQHPAAALEGAMLALRTARGVARGLLLRESCRRPVPTIRLARVPQRWSSSLPMNTVILFVPQQEAWVVERMGKFHRILEPGLNFLIPLLDRIRYVQSLKEIVINVPEQSAVTLDNVTLQIDGVLYLRIMDPYKASYGVEDPEYAVTQLAQTTMRSELGKLSLDKVFRERESLNSSIVDAINQASDYWGIRCLRYEIKDIHVPPRVKESMQMQVEAERRKRATVLESEGTRESAINVAEGRKQAQILASEADKAEQVNQAAGEAKAILVRAQAKAEAIRVVAAALAEQNGNAAASLSVAEQYVSAFSKLAKETNTILLPSSTGDITSMVAQAMGIYSSLSKPQPLKATEATAPPSTLQGQQPSITEYSEQEQPTAS
ncbi:stomatin-like protein 2, mitochondrial [Rhineura floridana]|uniref:stomatin-like protein 2, mitochondrial n=1 Tax=Rhineura floridana TaxID=261503 RepID=UPI002AC88FA9|nr:stomatin-like protein 2, mitochondrial [Rhineura floridana]